MTRFQRFVSSIAVVAVLFAPSYAQGQGVDRVKRRNGTDSGKITKVSPLAVTFSKGGVERQIPVEEIVSITFAGEPSELRSARLAASSGRYEDAMGSLGKISREQLTRPEVQQELDFLLVFCAGKLALAGQGNLEIATAEVSKFLTKNRSSFHLTEAIELSGDLFLAASNYVEARNQYTKLGKAPAPYYKARSAILLGRMLQSEGKHLEAIVKFDEAIAVADNITTKSQRLEATLLAAVSRSADGEVDQSTETIKKIIAEAPPEDAELLARAYNALGDSYLLSKNHKGARDAFLHVDLLFASASTEHAKALYKLSQLWSTLGREDRARDAKQRLQEEYPASPWASR